MEFSWGFAAARNPFPSASHSRSPATNQLPAGPVPAPVSTHSPLPSTRPSDKDEALLYAERQEDTGFGKHSLGQPNQSPSSTQLDSRFHSPFLRSSRTSSRSHSTLKVTSSPRRPRFLGHSRTSSENSQTKSSNETALQQHRHHQLQEPAISCARAELSLLSTYYGAEYPIVVRLPSRRAETSPSSVNCLHAELSPPIAPRANDEAATAAGLDTRPHADTVAHTIVAHPGPNTAASHGATPLNPSSASVSPPGRNSTLPALPAGGSGSSAGTGVYPSRTATSCHSAASPANKHLLNQAQRGDIVMAPDHGAYPTKSLAATGATPPLPVSTTSSTAATARAESVTSGSGTTTHSSRTMLSNEPSSGTDKAAMQLRPFVVRNGRSYVADATLPYPLPVDLAELHRQSLRTLLLCQLFGGPICSSVYANKPPTRVLEVGCGSAFWSMACHRHFARHGYTNISYTGIDIAPVAPGAPSTGSRAGVEKGLGGNRTSAFSSTSAGLDDRPDQDMKWRFVHHDIRTLPWPFADGEFDLVMVKDMSLATPLAMQQTLMDEYLRVLRPGGVIEIWESDYTLRMLRPHVPQFQRGPPQATRRPRDGWEAEETTSNGYGGEESEQDDHQKASSHGAYLMTANTPLSGPTNNFLVEYNSWISRALEARSLSAVPCTWVGALLQQEVDTLTAMQSKRLVVPLSEVRWEREGVGGVVTKDGKSYIETKGRRGGVRPEGGDGQPLSAGQAAVRKTALLTVVMQIQSLESILKEVSGKSQDEWDGWCGKMMNDLMKDNGTSWGESLEVGAWWATKKA